MGGFISRRRTAGNREDGRCELRAAGGVQMSYRNLFVSAGWGQTEAICSSPRAIKSTFFEGQGPRCFSDSSWPSRPGRR